MPLAANALLFGPTLLLACSVAPREQVPPAADALVLSALPKDVQHRTHIDFEGKVQLVGYTITPSTTPSPGSEVVLKLYWHSEQRLGHYWRLFTHLTEKGRLLTNLDKTGGLRNDPALEPSSWQPGHIYVDEQAFTVPVATDITILAGIWRELPVAGNDAEATATADSAAPADAPSSELPNSGRLTEYGEHRASSAAPAHPAVGLRLQVISGPADQENRAIVAHLRPTSAGN